MQLPLRYHRGQIKPYTSIPRINWDHPLTENLLFYHYDTPALGVDLVGGRLASLITANRIPVRASRWGTGHLYPSSTSDGIQYQGDAALRNGPPMSWACGFHRGTATSENTALFFGRMANSGNTAPKWNWGIVDFWKGNSNAVSGMVNNSGAFTEASSSAGTLGLNAYHTVLCVCPSTSSYSQYANGAFVNTISGLTIQNVTTGDNIGFGTDKGGPGSFQGFIHWGAFWGRTLTAQEARMLHDDPYCFLIYPEDEIFVLRAPTPPSGPTGTLVATEAADTASFTGTVTTPAVTGTLVTTEASDTASFAGNVIWTGTLITTEAADTAAFTGTVALPAVTGTLVSVEAADTASFAGNVTWTGALVATEAADTAAFQGSVLISGTLNATEAADTAAFQGRAAWTGTLVATEAADTAAFQGSVLVSGTLNATEAADIASFAGNVAWTGALVATEAADTASFPGAVAWTTTLVATEAADVAAFQGSVTWTGTLVATEGADVMAFSGAVVNPVSGTLVATEGADVASFSGAVGNITSGNLVATEGSDTASFTGTVSALTVTGTLVTTEASDALGQFTTFNPSDSGPNITLSNGNLTVDKSATGDSGIRSTSSKSSGKWYFEFTTDAQFTGSDSCVGIATANANLTTVGAAALQACVVYAFNGAINFNSGIATGFTIGNITSSTVGVAIDLDNKRIWFRKGSGNWNGVGTDNPATNTGGIDISALFPSNAAFILFSSNELNSGGTLNAGATAFVNSAPSGFSGWSSGWTGTVAWTTQLVATEGVDTASFNGLGSPVIAGTLVVTEVADTASFSGRAAWQAPLVATEQPDTASFTGRAAWQGTLVATEQSDIANFQGTAAFSPVTGILTAVEASDVLQFYSFQPATGTLVAMEGVDTCKILGQPLQEPGILHYGWPRVVVSRRL